MKKQNFSLLSLIFISSVTSPTRADSWSDLGKGLVAVGAAAVAVGATVWALNQEESDIDLITRAENIYKKSEPISSIFVISGIGVHEMSEFRVEKTSLMMLAQYSADGIEETVKRHLSSLYDISIDLNKRINNLKRIHNPEKRFFIDSMLILSENIASRITTIEKNILAFLNYHGAYLELFEFEQKLHKQYADAFAHLSYYPKNTDTRDMIKRVLYNQYHSKQYPYSLFLSELKYDINTLTSLLNKVTRSYPQREKMCYWVKEQLEYMRSVISTSSELERENIQKERDLLERQQRTIEKKQHELELERQRMLLAQQREQQRLHEEQLKALKKERKKIEKLKEALDKNQ